VKPPWGVENVAEEFENYDDLTSKAHQLIAEWESGASEGVVLAEDLASVERRLVEMVDALLHRFDELHARLWELEDKVGRLSDRLERLTDTQTEHREP
jgi:predicted  nucleic acid-binding Zn-ribbon protein